MAANDWDRVHREDKYAVGRAFAKAMEQLRNGQPADGSMGVSSPEEQEDRRRRARLALAEQREERLGRLEDDRKAQRLRDLERLDRDWSRRSRKGRR